MIRGTDDGLWQRKLEPGQEGGKPISEESPGEALVGINLDPGLSLEDNRYLINSNYESQQHRTF